MFRRKLSLSELLTECDKVASSLRENELDLDFKSHIKNLVNYVQNLPMLKSAHLNLIQIGCIRSMRKNSKCNYHILVHCYKLRGQYWHSWLRICIHIMEQHLYSTPHI
jgi:hypothetical protein